MHKQIKSGFFYSRVLIWGVLFLLLPLPCLRTASTRFALETRRQRRIISVQKLQASELMFVVLRLLYQDLWQVFLHVDFLYWFHINRPYLSSERGEEGWGTRASKMFVM